MKAILKSFITLSLICFVLFTYIFVQQDRRDPSYTKPLKEAKKLSKQQEIKDRLAQEKEMTEDPALGYVPRKALIKAREKTQQQINEMIQKAAIPNVVWNERGPNNVGGRTRTLMFDPNDNTNKKFWAGGVGGGVWYTDDITASNANWQRVDDFWSNMAVTAMDHDPVTTNDFYVGTGEGFGNADAIDGDGIWKSTDGGVTWNQLANTTSFNDCNKIVCFKANHIIVATNNGLRVSTNSGGSWTTVRSGSHSDVEVAANGDLYASNFGGDIFKSTDDGSTWTTVRNGSGGRVEIATAPNDADYVYAIVSGGGQVSNILKSTNAGGSWTDKVVPPYRTQGCSDDPNNTFARGQAWYDLIALVSPTDKEKVIIGGVDLYRTEDGGDTWGTISYWTGGCDAYVHADQHALISRPGNPNEIVVGNDGGVSYSANAFSTGSNPTWNTQNENYNVTQFYAIAVHPTAGVNNILAGAQDNGTKRLTTAGIGGGSNVTGGDGAFCHIDQNEPNNQLTSYVYNNYYVSTNGTNFQSYSLGNTGRFINPTDYDDNTNKLYACRGSNQYLIVENVGGTLSNQTKTISQFGGQVSCVKVSPNTANRVFFGISGQRICRIDDAAGTPVFTDLGNPSSGYISSIDVEVGNDNHLLVTYSNYGVTSVFESTNGGSSWTAVEGDLPNMPIRWGIFDPNNSDQAIVATELGVWTTDNLNGASTDWDPTNSGLANVRVDMVEYRSSDHLMVAGTHGRGVFTSESFNLDCNIGNVVAGTQNCDPNTDTYTQEITVTLNNTPSTGQITIGGQNFNFPYDQSTTMQTYTLTNLTADGNQVDLLLEYTALPSCNRTAVNVFTAPNPGCVLNNNICTGATVMNGTGTYTTDGPSDGNGCYNCSNAQHADWWQFTAPSDGTVDIASCLKGVDTRFWFYEGDCASGLTQIGGNDDACAMSQGGNAWASEELNISVVGGNTYLLEWDNRWSTSGFDFDFTFNPTGGGGCAGQDHLFVDLNASGDDSGCDWANAVPNLQDAIDLAASNPDVTALWVKAGTYNPGTSAATPDRFTSITVSKALSILGGFVGTETDASQRNASTNVTILSGDIGTVNSTGDNSYHVISHASTNEFTIDGFTIEKGNANNAPNLNGAGVINSGALTLIDCILRDHLSTNDGSAVTNSGTQSMLKMENVEFINNSNVPMVNGVDASIVVESNSTLIID